MPLIITNIQWDTDGDKKTFDRLPSSISIKEETLIDLIGETLGDYITDETGFCHFGFDVEGLLDYQSDSNA